MKRSNPSPVLFRMGAAFISSIERYVSTGNRIPRSSAQPSRFRSLKFVADPHINTMYEAVIEATEGAVLDAMFCSIGVTGREAPPIPQE